MAKFAKNDIVTDGRGTYKVRQVKKAPMLGFDQCYLLEDNAGNTHRSFEQHLCAA